MKNRIKAPVLSAVAALTVSGCLFDLDVGNPNNLTRESIDAEVSSAAVTNGALSLVSTAIPDIWQPYLVASDEMYWIGSRDAWLSLDQGFVNDPYNEFLDGPFPNVGRATWMAREAVRLNEEHVTNNAGDEDFLYNLARGQLYYGVMLMVTGEVMEDMAFSDMAEAAQPYSQQGKTMADVIGEGITQLDRAITNFTTLGEDDFLLIATAMRARAAQSQAISAAINPVGTTPTYVDAGGTDAAAAITLAGGVTADWNYDLAYSATTQSNPLGSWINERKENQFDLSLVNVDADNDVLSVRLQDPIDGGADPALTKRLAHFRGTAADVTASGNQYGSLTVVSTRLMHLILAENALAQATPDQATFELHINHIRDMDGLSDFTGQISNFDMLQHTRRVNTLVMGLRLADMYRWGLRPGDASPGTHAAATWSNVSVAFTEPGTMLPITIIECRANEFLDVSSC